MIVAVYIEVRHPTGDDAAWTRDVEEVVRAGVEQAVDQCAQNGDMLTSVAETFGESFDAAEELTAAGIEEEEQAEWFGTIDFTTLPDSDVFKSGDYWPLKLTREEGVQIVDALKLTRRSHEETKSSPSMEFVLRVEDYYQPEAVQGLGIID